MTVMDQRLFALEKANGVRIARARVRREIKALPRSEAAAVLADLVESCPDWLASEQTHRLLMWPPKYGAARVRLMLGLADVRGARRLGELSDRQRSCLAGMLRSGRAS